MKAYDLTNQRFGRLVALYKSSIKKGNKYPWHCQCDCGNELDVATDALTHGHTRSCGCLQKEIASKIGKKYITIAQKSQLKDYTNQRFGHLIVLFQVRINGQLKWCCQCDCGNITDVSTADLTSGNTQSCGCIKSRGESAIANLLIKNNISFVQEKSFVDCKYPDTLGQCRFDFYVNNSYLIEYDGSQHFKDNSFFRCSLIQQQEKDEYKNQWCKMNNIPLIRIPYWHLNQLKISDLVPDTSEFIINK